MYYYYSEPPYFLLVAGMLVALTSGAAFSATLKLIVQKWSSDRAAYANAGDAGDAIARFATRKLTVPFLGISAGVCMFLSAGLSIFGFVGPLPYVVAVPLTLLVSLLVWYQLGSMLALVERKGFEAIDIDFFG